MPSLFRQVTRRAPRQIVGNRFFAGLAFLHKSHGDFGGARAACSGRRRGAGQEHVRGKGRCRPASPLRGAFSFAYWDEKSARTDAGARLRTGKSPFSSQGRRRDFCLRICPIFWPIATCRTIWMRSLSPVFFLMMDISSAGPFFQGVERVQRHAVTIRKDRIDHRAYWAPIHGRAIYRRDADYIERARELLDQAVARSIGDEPKFAVMASGGLDSSAILSTLARRGRSEITCFHLRSRRGPVASASAGSIREREAENRSSCEAVSVVAIQLSHGV